MRLTVQSATIRVTVGSAALRIAVGAASGVAVTVGASAVTVRPVAPAVTVTAPAAAVTVRPAAVALTIRTAYTGEGAGSHDHARLIETLTAAAALGGGRAVRIDASGLAAYADSATAAHAGSVVGVTTHAAEAGSAVRVCRAGRHTDAGWSFGTVGGAVYVGAGGVLTQTPPAAGFVQRIGIAESATSMTVQIGEPVVLA